VPTSDRQHQYPSWRSITESDVVAQRSAASTIEWSLATRDHRWVGPEIVRVNLTEAPTCAAFQ
jgi:hypothetical protein